nr:hypothetical protein [Tanacetum cinerariifolium]
MAGDNNHDGDHPETSNTTPPVSPPTQQIPHTVSSIKLPILKKGKCDIWAIKMKHYLSHTDYPIWQVIQNGNGPVSVTTDTNRMIKVLPLKLLKRKRKARTTLLMSLPEDHLAKFHQMADAKEVWEAIKSRFSGCKPEVFKVLPSSWSQVALIMRTKPGLDTLSFDDLYNNLRVFERDVKGTTALSSSITQNVTFVSADNTSSTNDVAMISTRIKKFHKRTGKKLQFDTKDPVGFDKTKVECFNCYKIRHFARDYKAKGNQDSKRRDVGYNENKARDNGRRPAYQDDSKGLVTIDEEEIDWCGHVEEDAQNYAMMAYSSSNSGSDNEDKFGLEYGDYRYGSVLSYENEVLQSVFMNKESDLEDTSINDRYADGMHATLVDKSDSKTSEYTSCESDSSKPNHSPKVEKKGRNGHTRKGLGYAFIGKACFICGSFSHLIRDCDFHEKGMAKQAALTKSKNKVNIKESSIHRTLKLDDAEGISCLANADIFDGLDKMGYEKLFEKLTFYKAFFSPLLKLLSHTVLQCLSAKTTSWNEFSSTMASTIICLATKFVQLLIDHQLGDMSYHKDIYANPPLSKKVFANMKRVGAGFSGVVTALFDNMLVPAAEEVGLLQANVQLTTIPTKLSTSTPHKKQKSKKQKPQATKVLSPTPLPEHRLPSPSNDPLPAELESEIIYIKSSSKERIEKLKGRVAKLEEENIVSKELHSKADIAALVDTAVKASAGCNWRNKRNSWNKVFKYNSGSKIRKSTICQKLYGIQLTMLHSKELASPKQMDFGKDFSNLLLADNLPKIECHGLYKDVDPHEFTHV